MPAEKELKPTSFRIDKDTADKFKEIANNIGGNQQEALAKLIEAYEFQQGKSVLSSKKEDIEKFELYITAATRIFMNCLEENQNITEIVRAQFDALLISKDTIIQDLQENLTVAKQLKEEAVNKSKFLHDENNNYANQISGLMLAMEDSKRNYDSIIEDKNNLNKALTDSCNELKLKNETMMNEYNEFKDKVKQLDKVLNERDALQKDKAFLEKEIIVQKQLTEDEFARAKEHYERLIESSIQKAELLHQKELLNIESKYQEQLQQLKEEKQNEIDKYQAKYFDLLEKMNENARQ